MKTFDFLPGEYWYGGAVYDGFMQPVGEDKDIIWDLRENPTPNQAMPLYLSSKGRYLWSDEGFFIHFSRGTIEIEGNRDIILKAYRGACPPIYGICFPGQGMECVMDQFMIGDKLLVAPVYKKGENGRSVAVPSGLWKTENSFIEGKGEAVEIISKLGCPVVLEKIDA